MNFQKQKFLHNPKEGSYGDCHRTCLAIMFGLDRDNVPNFGMNYDDNLRFLREEKEWLAVQGFSAFNIAYQSDTKENVMRAMAAANPDMYYMLAGESAGGTNHSVIALNDAIVWDPSLNDSGIIGPCSDGYFWVQTFVPLWLKKGLG